MLRKKMRLKTGVEGLDTILDGGIPRSRLVLLSGPSGSGKTTLGAHFIYHGAKHHKQPGVIALVGHDRDALHRDMKAIGFDFSKLHDKHFKLIGGPVSKLKHLRHRTSASMKDIVDEIGDVVEDHGAERLLVDSLNMSLLMFDEKDRREAKIHLIDGLAKLDCATMLVRGVGHMPHLPPEEHHYEEFAADGIIDLHHVRDGNSLKRGIRVRKMKGAEHDTSLRHLHLSHNGLVVGDDLV